jgi:hypothetical protein
VWITGRIANGIAPAMLPFQPETSRMGTLPARRRSLAALALFPTLSSRRAQDALRDNSPTAQVVRPARAGRVVRCAATGRGGVC